MIEREGCMGDLSKALWAKKDDYQGKGEWLPLQQHLEDTCGVCGFLWEHWLCDGQRRIIAGDYGQDVGKRIMLFLGAIHDLGKATPAFQLKTSGMKRSDLDLELLERLERAGAKGITELKLANAKESPHNIAGEALLRRFEERFLTPEDISSIVGGHHGRPASYQAIEEQLTAYQMNYFQAERAADPLWSVWEKSQRGILDWALARAGFAAASKIPPLSVPAQVQALGLLTMADWIASNTNYFPLIRMEEEAVFDSKARLEEGVCKWFKTHGWEPEEQQEIPAAFQHRFGFPPRPVQKIFLNTIASCRQPGLFILEAPMGLGKTEAALFGAEELAYRTDRKGIFFGLPTQATSNGIFPRIEKWLQSIYEDGKKEGEDNHSRIELRLIHGKANLNEDYVKLTNASHIAVDGDPYEAFVTNQWFSGKKTAVLDDFVVGTVDQFLMAALKQKHLALRQLAFAGKVVVIDEVHAYDAYMSQYLQMALTWMASYRVPVILLSATLSARSRVELTRTYLKGLGVRTSRMLVEGEPLADYLSSEDYPLITCTDGETVRQIRDFPANVERKVSIERINDADMEAVIDDTFADGGNIGIIVNTVKRAQELAEKLAERYGEDMVELLHSSFLATERVRKEAKLMHMLGKGKEAERPVKKIVVGTQVIEQSLDIDFDLMISELAPVDLLIQRLGRLHRHDRARPAGCREPKLYLLGCSEELDFQGGSEAVYGGFLLARSQYFLGASISLPGDISPLVQAVYGEQEIELEPDAEEKYHEYKKKAEEQQAKMRMRAKAYRLTEPYLGERRMDRLTLHDWLDHPTEDKSDESGNSQVRDADESIEVIALQKVENGYGTLFGDLSGHDLSARVQEAEIGRRLAGETLRLPRPLCLPYRIEKTIHELEDIYLKSLREWNESSWLKGSLGLLFDADMNCSLNGYRLHYDQKYGLSYQKEE
jgi:CRISPR-associated endonuclease/helicase Cas3